MRAYIAAVGLAGAVLMIGCSKDVPPPPPQTEAMDTAGTDAAATDTTAAPVSSRGAGRTVVGAESRMAAQRLRDSLRRTVRARLSAAERVADQTAIVRIASPTPHATLYVNDVEEGPLTADGRAVRVQAGMVRLVIQAPPCAAWDTVMTLPPRAQAALGVRRLRC